MSTLKVVLQNARRLIDREDHWCQERYAEDDSGCETDPVCGNPTRFCLLGAVRHVIGVPWGTDCDVYKEAQDVLHIAARAADLGCATIVEFNDFHSHAEVLRVMDEAIQNISA